MDFLKILSYFYVDFLVCYLLSRQNWWDFGIANLLVWVSPYFTDSINKWLE